MSLSLSKILLLALFSQSELNLFDEKPDPNGHYAFGYGGQSHDDISLPNPKFFDALEKRIKRNPGLRIELIESALLTRNGPEKARDFGRYLGRRFMRRKNFNYVAPAKPSEAMKALIDGIRDYDTTHWLKGMKQ
jgi:hypothetical protein